MAEFEKWIDSEDIKSKIANLYTLAENIFDGSCLTGIGFDGQYKNDLKNAFEAGQKHPKVKK